MPRSKEQQEGIDYEVRMAKRIGGDIQAGSGNQWYAKLDISKRAILWSLKHTGKDFFRLSRAVLQEAIKAALDEGCIPGWMIDIAGEDFIFMRADDFMMLLEEDEKIIKPSKAAMKHRAAQTPALLRTQDDEPE